MEAIFFWLKCPKKKSENYASNSISYTVRQIPIYPTVPQSKKELGTARCRVCLCMESEDQHQQLISPVGEHACAQTANGVAHNGGAGELAALEAIHHGHMGAEVTAPAHAHGGEYGDVMGIGKAVGDQILDDGDGSAG